MRLVISPALRKKPMVCDVEGRLETLVSMLSMVGCLPVALDARVFQVLFRILIGLMLDEIQKRCDVIYKDIRILAKMLYE